LSAASALTALRRTTMPPSRRAVTATFRFHAELNTFLSPALRGRAVCLRCAEAATVKHMVEALGVPHTEAGQVLVNGAPASMEHLVAEGDQVLVFPPADETGAAGTGPPRFAADAHLGGLARMLRMAGFDTRYENDWDDAALVALARAERRTVLSRDRDLLKRRDVERGCYLHEVEPERQLQALARRLGLARHARPFTRCLRCNVELEDVSKEAVQDALPGKVRERGYSLRRCATCGRVYWQGSHWQRMASLLAAADLAPPP
jgi:uncharacterized protein with PIN domain